ncbi:MAG: DUF4388 domain-containing protein [Candidatus Obscuribacterales bacterium]|nr:DUF4388 domain-containing protein [Candidatus Obscuribacterales bacterium]
MQLSGELSKVNLPNLVQLARNGELNGKICLTRGVHTAFIYVEKGRIFHVETDTAEGRQAFLELFLWEDGTFSYVECPLKHVPMTISPDESLDKIMREGMACVEAKEYLSALGISKNTILKPLIYQDGADNQLLAVLDGKRNLAKAIDELGWVEHEWMPALHAVLKEQQIVIVEPVYESGPLKLPDWVISRLQQDNPDVSQAIIDLVIWSDRIKCWLYQADADLERVIGAIESVPDKK